MPYKAVVTYTEPVAAKSARISYTGNPAATVCCDNRSNAPQNGRTGVTDQIIE